MVIENLQITPFMEWLLGSGWYKASSGSRWESSCCWSVLVGGGLALLFALRRSSAAPGPAVSLWIGGIFGGLSLLVLAAVALCSTAITRNWLTDHVASPLFNALAPLLGPNWTDGALYTWLAVATGLTGVVYACCWLVSVLVGGPLAGTRQCGRAVVDIAIDIARMSPRRVFALAWLAVRESLRRRVVVVFVVFVVLILFAALFIKKDSLHPGQLYIQVVLNFTIYLSMLFALVLSALSLPADIRDRTLHTVVTKPVRKIEIVLGRVLGFIFVGTILLGGIGLISYGFTVRSLNHTHQLTADMLHAESLPGNRGTLLRGTTSRSHGHEHEVTIDPSGEATVETQKDHTHDLYVSGSGDKAVYALGPPKGQLQARVPIYGKLSFLDETGKPKEKGINVGDEWTYRSFIEGRTAAAAIWTFDGLSEDLFPESKFPNGIPVEMTHRGLPHPQGQPGKRRGGDHHAGQPQDRQAGLSAEFPRQEIRHRRADDSPQFLHCGQRRQSGKDRSVSRPGQRRRPVGDHPAMPGTPAVLRHGPGRPVHPRRRQFVCLEFLQGLPGNLAANGLGHQPGRDVQHVPQRPGRLAGDDVRRSSPGCSAATLSNWPAVRWWEAGRSNRSSGS